MENPLTALTPAELEEHGRWLRRLARRLAHDEAGGDDLAQDAWLQFARSGARARDVRGFLAGIVRNLARKRAAGEQAREVRERRAARSEELPSPDALSASLELSRGLDELRARLDRRHAGGREAWSAVALAFRRETLASAGVAGVAGVAGGGLLMTTWTKLAALAAIVVAGLLGVWAATRPASPGGAGRSSAAEARTSVIDREGAPELAAGSALDGARVTAPTDAPAREASGQVSLLVVDRSTGDPLPQYGVRLIEVLDDESDGRELETVTDAHGRTAFSSEWFERPFKTLAFDHALAAESDVVTRRWDMDERPASGEELRLEVAVGPTYRLRFVDPLPPEASLWATLSAGEEVRPDVWWSLTPLRAAPDGPWVRFTPSVSSVRLGLGPWRLVVRDEAGFFVAWGEPTSVAGVQEEEVVLRAQVTGTIDVAARVGGARPRTRLSLGLYRIPDGPLDRPASIYPAETDWLQYGSGDRTKHLRPGTWRVSVGSDIHAFEQQVVEVLAGQATPVEFDFEPREELGRVRVVVKSETGRVTLGAVSVVATREGRDFPVRGRFLEGTWNSTTYLCDGLEDGEWTVRLERVEHLPQEWSPGLEQTVRPDGREIVFTCMDAEAPPAHSGRVLVRDAQSGEPILDAGVTDYVNGARKLSQHTRQDGGVSIGPFLEGHPVQIAVRAAGYRAARLEDLSLPFDEPLVVELEPGWGAVFEVVGSGSVPLADVAVVLDGAEVGRTDDEGRLLANLGERPARVEFRHDAWELAPGYELDAASGTLGTNETLPIWVVLRPQR